MFNVPVGLMLIRRLVDSHLKLSACRENKENIQIILTLKERTVNCFKRMIVFVYDEVRLSWPAVSAADGKNVRFAFSKTMNQSDHYQLFGKNVGMFD